MPAICLNRLAQQLQLGRIGWALDWQWAVHRPLLGLLLGAPWLLFGIAGLVVAAVGSAALAHIGAKLVVVVRIAIAKRHVVVAVAVAVAVVVVVVVVVAVVATSAPTAAARLVLARLRRVREGLLVLLVASRTEMNRDGVLEIAVCTVQQLPCCGLIQVCDFH